MDLRVPEAPARRAVLRWELDPPSYGSRPACSPNGHAFSHSAASASCRRSSWCSTEGTMLGASRKLAALLSSTRRTRRRPSRPLRLRLAYTVGAGSSRPLPTHRALASLRPALTAYTGCFSSACPASLRAVAAAPRAITVLRWVAGLARFMLRRVPRYLQWNFRLVRLPRPCSSSPSRIRATAGRQDVHLDLDVRARCVTVTAERAASGAETAGLLETERASRCCAPREPLSAVQAARSL
jgi:hypothetical protein